MLIKLYILVFQYFKFIFVSYKHHISTSEYKILHTKTSCFFKKRQKVSQMDVYAQLK